jgi:uncharacterized membrane protein
VTREQGSGVGEPADAQALGVEDTIARLLIAGTLVGVAALAVGVVLMAAQGISPTSETYPAFDAGRLLPDLVALRAEGFLWAGIVVLVATPVARVIGELVSFAVRRDRLMVGVSAAILGIIVLSVALAIEAEA